MKVWPMQVAIRYAHPKDSLRICQHYRMCRAPQETHIVHYALEWLLQYQEQLVFVYQEGCKTLRLFKDLGVKCHIFLLVNSTSSCVARVC
jgi:hypothetical protein